MLHSGILRVYNFISTAISWKLLHFRNSNYCQRASQWTWRSSHFQNEMNSAQKNAHLINAFILTSASILRLVDEALQSMQTRIEQYEWHCSNFGFLFSSTTLQNTSNDDIFKSYKDLDLLLTSRDDLYSEILLFKHYLTSNNLSDVNEAQAINCIKDNNNNNNNSVVMLAPSAYLASAATTTELTSSLLQSTS